MTIRNCCNELDFPARRRLGVNRVELAAANIGEGIAVDGCMHFPLLGRVLANGPESAWPAGQLLACCVERNISPGDVIDVDAVRVLAVADDVEPEAALQMPLMWPLLHVALRGVLRLKVGDSVLVHRADGQFGAAAIKLAVSLGCVVMAVCADRDGVARALAAGAAEAARYTDDWPVLLREHGGVDAVFDPDGGQWLSRSLGCARRGARLGAFDASGLRPELHIEWSELWGRKASVAVVDWSPVREWQFAGIARKEFSGISG